jgi:hypothetical protein
MSIVFVKWIISNPHNFLATLDGNLNVSNLSRKVRTMLTLPSFNATKATPKPEKNIISTYERNEPMGEAERTITNIPQRFPSFRNLNTHHHPPLHFPLIPVILEAPLMFLCTNEDYQAEINAGYKDKVGLTSEELARMPKISF